ncbi:MAG: DUF4118 domain-containing protein [Acidobacteriota bacterium]
MGRRTTTLDYGATAILVGVTICILKLFPGLTDASVALLMLLSVFASAWAFEAGPGAFSAILAALGFNFFFLPPFYTLTIDDPRNVTAFLVFLTSGLLVGNLSAVARRRLRIVRAEREDLASLVGLAHGFLADTSREGLAGLAADRLRRAMGCDRVSVWISHDGKLSEAAQTPGPDARADLLALAFDQGNSAAIPSAVGGVDVYLPIAVGLQRAGAMAALGLRRNEKLAEGCALLLGLSLERERFLRMARAAEEKAAIDGLKTTLLATLAHDLKTPVAAALAAVENLLAAGGKEGLAVAHEELLRLSRHVSTLLEMVRIDAGVARPRRERVRCEEVVEAAIARFGDALSRHHLHVDVVDPTIVVDADPPQLAEALGHGLENAARYSPPGTEIRVSVAQDPTAVFLRVADAGRGVPEEDRERVMERFVRLPETSGVPGTGLGLSIARSLVEMNGGRLSIGSSALGGALFQIAMPRAA